MRYHTLQSFKNTFSNRNLDQNICSKMLYFLKKLEKSPQRWELRTQTSISLRRLEALTPDLLVVIPINYYTYFSKAFVAKTSLLSKRSESNSEIAMIFRFCPSFLILNSVQDTLANATDSDFSSCNNYDLYYIILE